MNLIRFYLYWTIPFLIIRSFFRLCRNFPDTSGSRFLLKKLATSFFHHLCTCRLVFASPTIFFPYDNIQSILGFEIFFLLATPSFIFKILEECNNFSFFSRIIPRIPGEPQIADGGRRQQRPPVLYDRIRTGSFHRVDAGEPAATSEPCQVCHTFRTWNLRERPPYSQCRT